MKRIAGLVLLLVLCLSLFGCRGGGTPQGEAVQATPAPASIRMAMVLKDNANRYMIDMYEGFSNACAEFGGEAILAEIRGTDAKSQIDAIRALVAEGVDAVAVAANDSEALSPVLEEAMAAGVYVISLDSAADSRDRNLHIQQASPEAIGRVLIQAAAQMIGGAGEIGIITTTPAMPNQAQWLLWMRRELSDNAKAYANITLCQVAYGLDDYDATYAALDAMAAEHPDLRLVIVPSTVGMGAAGDWITEHQSSILLTGLGLPSECAPFIESGVCPWMYLWNPMDLGYFAAYAAKALALGEITGAAGELADVGTFGKRQISRAADGGTELVVGNPYQFDGNNIYVWKELF